jgi:hypothetical protein
MLPPVMLTGTIKIAEGQSQYLSFRQLVAEVTFAQGVLKSTQRANLYDGSYQGTVQVNFAPAELAYSWDAKVDGVKLGEVMAQFTPAKSFFEGALTAQLKLAGHRLTWAAIGQTISGEGTVHITKVKYMPPDAMPKPSREVTILSPLGNVTTHIRIKPNAVNAVDATFHIGQGKVFCDPLQLSGEDVIILAKGYLGVDRSVDYNGHLVLAGQRAREHGILSAFLRDTYGRIILPFAVKGTVHDAKISVDTKDVWHGGKAR